MGTYPPLLKLRGSFPSLKASCMYYRWRTSRWLISYVFFVWSCGSWFFACFTILTWYQSVDSANPFSIYEVFLFNKDYRVQIWIPLDFFVNFWRKNILGTFYEVKNPYNVWIHMSYNNTINCKLEKFTWSFFKKKCRFQVFCKSFGSFIFKTERIFNQISTTHLLKWEKNNIPNIFLMMSTWYCDNFIYTNGLHGPSRRLFFFWS